MRGGTWIGSLLIALALATSGAATQAATNAANVGANVVSASSVGPGGCLPGVLGRTEFGGVAAATNVVTSDDCTVTFGSSNSTATLRIAQLDGAGMALAAAPDRRHATWANNGESQVTGIPSLAAGGGMATAMQSDGKLVVAGWVNLIDDESVIYRLNADGTLDTAGFNAPNGYVQFNTASGQSEEFRGVAVQTDGSIIAVGTARTGGSTQDATIAKVNADGTKVLAFGGGGTGFRVEDLGASTGGSDEGFRVPLPQADGTLLVGGTEVDGDASWVLQRYLANGLPDPAVGGGSGRVSINPTGNHDQLFSLVPDTRGGYLAGGQGQPSLFEGYVARVTASLALDTAWGTSGFHRYGAGTRYPHAIELHSLPDGSALVAYHEQSGTATSAKLAKLLPNGSGFDTTGFASPTGIAVLPIYAGNYGHIRSFEVDVIGRIYALYQQFGSGAIIARLTSAGVLDTTFGTGGATALDPNLNQVPYGALHLQGNSLVFFSAHGSNSNDRMLRYGGPEVDDYVDLGGGTDRDWSSGATTSTFGVCLRDRLVATADWAIDADNDCTIDDDDAWQPIARRTTDPGATAAHTTTSGATGTVHLRFGFRPSESLTAGQYEAPLLFEVVSP